MDKGMDLGEVLAEAVDHIYLDNSVFVLLKVL